MCADTLHHMALLLPCTVHICSIATTLQPCAHPANCKRAIIINAVVAELKLTKLAALHLAQRARNDRRPVLAKVVAPHVEVLHTALVLVTSSVLRWDAVQVTACSKCYTQRYCHCHVSIEPDMRCAVCKQISVLCPKCSYEAGRAAQVTTAGASCHYTRASQPSPQLS